MKTTNQPEVWSDRNLSAVEAMLLRNGLADFSLDWSHSQTCWA